MFGLFRRASRGRSPVRLDLKSDDFFADPYPTYAALQRAEPVHWCEEGFWFLSSYADVREALGDARLSNRPAPFAVLHARNRDQRIAADIANRLVAFLDPPEHTALRGPIAKGFRQALAALQPDFAACVTDVMGGFAEGDQIEFVTDCAEPIAARAACAMFGFPVADGTRLTAWSYDFFTLFHAVPDAATLDALEARLGAFRDYVAVQLNDAEPATVTGLLAQEIGDRLTEAEVIDNIMLLVADAIGNVQAALSAAVHLLLLHPKIAQGLAAGDRVERIVDEALRLESPGQFQGRITLEPVEIGGKTIPARSIVLLAFGAANRDPAAFDRPEMFDPDRATVPHLAFGGGRHMCLGQAVVRQMLAAMLPALCDAHGLAFDASGEVTWQRRYGHRWLDCLPLRIRRGESP